MKKILSLFLALIFVFSLTACSNTEKTAITNSSDDEAIDDVINALPTDDPIYEETALMLPSVEKFVEYNHILGNTVDYDNVSSEDFWNIVALAIAYYPASEDYAEVDVAGVYSIKWSDAIEFAKSFMYKSWFANSAPNYNSSYSASANPGTGVIDLLPLGVDNYDAKLDYIEAATDKDGCAYIMHIVLQGRDGNDDYDHHYDVYLADWEDYLRDYFDKEDTGDHILPYTVVGYKRISSELREVEGLEEDSADSEELETDSTDAEGLGSDSTDAKGLEAEGLGLNNADAEGPMSDAGSAEIGASE